MSSEDFIAMSKTDVKEQLEYAKKCISSSARNLVLATIDLLGPRDTRYEDAEEMLSTLSSNKTGSEKVEHEVLQMASNRARRNTSAVKAAITRYAALSVERTRCAGLLQVWKEGTRKAELPNARLRRG
jgi:hypothetical protein